MLLDPKSVISYDWLAATALLAILLTVLYQRIVYRLYLHPANQLPGPPIEWIPFSGNLKQVLTMSILECLVLWSKQYGGIFRYRAPGYDPHVVITDPKLVKQVLMTKHDIFVKPLHVREGLAIRLGYGMVVAEGEVHRQQRKVLNPLFSVQAIRQIYPLMAMPIIKLRNLWLEQVDSGKTVTVNVLPAFLSMTLDVVARAVLGQDFQCLDRKEGTRGSRFLKAYEDVQHLEPRWQHLLCFIWPWVRRFRDLPTTPNILFKRALSTLHEESLAIVEETVQSKAAGADIIGVLGQMLKGIDGDTDHGVSTKELQDQCLTFLHAGHESTALAFSWTLWLMAKHPDIQHEVRKEIRQAFEAEQSETLPYDTIQRLQLLSNICKESLRVVPPIPVTLRTATEDTLVGDYLIPKGTFVMIAPFASHRQQEWWGDDALLFRPSRWNEAPANEIDPYIYMPFLAGTHQCIGHRFAWAELKLALAILLKDFHFTEKPGFEPGFKHQVSLAPKYDMQLLMQKID
ncbi:cytochrome P450 [Radiomyces spectabilis]|uniref:cytochrome P450 n=1 Tax=Radiomyces spectabilis TaxID=64574 RepID=UPI00221FDC5D|nr:cytochrome P450 [Radiomyces spectabilis]KAI8391113.1 cytochrome P450 [Radiomyces spectabilis]